jgi:hypothetical protein
MLSSKPAARLCKSIVGRFVPGWRLRNLDPIVAKLAKAQNAFFHAADAIPCGQWTARPGDEKWSAGEVATHLILVEQAIVEGARKVSRKTPRAIPLLKRVHLPMSLAEIRVVKLNAPPYLNPTQSGTKEETLGKLRAAREDTLAFLKETQQRDLSAYRWRHPFLGMLNTYEWFEMIAAHQIRHAKQVVEIATALPKPVTSAENR